MNVDDLHAWIGSDRHEWVPGCAKTVREKTSIRTSEKDGTRVTQYVTPASTLTAVSHYDTASWSWHPVEFPVKTREDIRVMSAVFSDAACEFDSDEFDRASRTMQEIREDGIAATGIGVSPLMDWIQHLAGIENGHLMLHDHREDVESLFEAMHAFLCRRARVIADNCPAPVVYSVENTSTTLISPDLFRRYCHTHLMDYGNIVSAAGKLHVLHMCGHLKKVLADVAELPAVAIEAFTSPPVGNTTFKDGRDACPDICLVGGTNATLWTKSAATIFGRIRQDLDELPHHRGIVVTSAGVMPPLCKPETIKEVGDLVRSHPVS
jgi:hypothetical protein